MIVSWLCFEFWVHRHRPSGQGDAPRTVFCPGRVGSATPQVGGPGEARWSDLRPS